MGHTGDMNVIVVMQFGIVETNLPRIAIIKNVILRIGIRRE